jgi:hypothetical protein
MLSAKTNMENKILNRKKNQQKADKKSIAQIFLFHFSLAKQCSHLHHRKKIQAMIFSFVQLHNVMECINVFGFEC